MHLPIDNALELLSGVLFVLGVALLINTGAACIMAAFVLFMLAEFSYTDRGIALVPRRKKKHPDEIK
jgi:hypothetical protein